MNDLTTQSQMQSTGSPLRIELAKMLGLVAPVTMSADQCTLWLASAEDALLDIRPHEVAEVSMEVRRSVTRPSQIVPEIARLVAEKRARKAKPISSPLPELPPRNPGPPLTAEEIAKLPRWLKETGLRVGFLRRDGDRIVDCAR